MIKENRKTKIIWSAIATGCAAGFVNGFLGAGGGIILLWALKILNTEKGEQAVRDNFASTVAAILLLSTVSAVTYSHTGKIDTETLLKLVLPGIVGGVFGAFLTDKLNTSLLKFIFSVLIIIAGINMIV